MIPALLLGDGLGVLDNIDQMVDAAKNHSFLEPRELFWFRRTSRCFGGSRLLGFDSTG